MRWIIILVAVLSCTNASAQGDSTFIKIVGTVISEDQGEKLPFVHIVNTRSGLGVITDSVGSFTIKIKHTDTLVFKSIGFEDKQLTGAENANSKLWFCNVRLKTKTYSLKQVDILSLNSKSQFEYDLVNMKIEPDKNRIYIPGVNMYVEREPRVGPFLPGNRGVFYNLTKEAKSYRKLEELLKQDAIAARVAKKYNKTIVNDISGFNNDTLLGFYKHIKLSDDYVLKSQEYDIYKRILDSLPLFKLRISSDTAYLNTLNP